MASYFKEGGLRDLVALNSEEQARSDAFESSPAVRADLDREIANQRDPSARAILIAHRDKLPDPGFVQPNKDRSAQQATPRRGLMDGIDAVLSESKPQGQQAKRRSLMEGLDAVLAEPMPKAIESKTSAGAFRTAADMGIKAAQGVVGLGQSAVGAASLATGGLAGEGMRAMGYDPERTKQAMGEYLSDDQKAADQSVQQAEGFVDTVLTAIQNPRSIAGGVAESLPGMAVMGGAARAFAGRIAAQAAAPLGGLGTEAGAAAARKAIEANAGRLMSIGAGAEGVLAAGQTADTAQGKGRTYGEYALPAIGAGVGTAAIGKLSGKYLGGDAETALFTGARSAAFRGSAPIRTLRGALVEGGEEALQSTNEKAFGNVAEGTPWQEGLGNAAGMGLVTGAPMGGAMSAMRGRGAIEATVDEALTTPPSGQPQPEPTAPPASRLQDFDVETSARYEKQINAVKVYRQSGDAKMADMVEKSMSQRVGRERAGLELETFTQDPAQFHQMPSFGANYQALRSAGTTPAEAAPKAATYAAFEAMASDIGLSQAAIQAAVKNASAKQLDELPAYFEKYTNALAKSQGLQAAPNIADALADHQIDAAAAVAQHLMPPVPRETPAIDPVMERIKAMPGSDRLEAMAAYGVMNRQDAPKGVQKYNSQLLDRLLAKHDRDGQPSEVNQPLAQSNNAQAASETVAPVTPYAPQDQSQDAQAWRDASAYNDHFDVSAGNGVQNQALDQQQQAQAASESVANQSDAGNPALRVIPEQFSAALAQRTESVPAARAAPTAQGTQPAAAQPSAQATESQKTNWKDVIYRKMSTSVFRESVSKSIQNDGQKVLDAADQKDVKALSEIASKYAQEAGRNQGGGGAGPGKVKQARRGVEDVFYSAMMAIDGLSIKQPPAQSNAAQAAINNEAVNQDLGRTGTRPKGGQALRKAAYEKNPLMTFLATHGLYHEKDKPNSQKAEFSPDKNIMVMGHGPIFKRTGKQLDELLPMAIQDGYLPLDGTEDQLYSLIQQAVAGKKVIPMYAKGVEDNFKARQDAANEAEQEADQFGDGDFYEGQDGYVSARASVAELSLDELTDIERVVFSAANNTTREQAMRALGFTEQEIQDDPQQAKTSQGNQQPVQTTTSPAQEDRAGRAQEAPVEGLTTQTPADLQAKSDREAATEKKARNTQQAADKAAAQDDERKRIAKASEAASDTFELGGNAMDNLTGQKDIFGAEPVKSAEPTTKERSIDGFKAGDIVDVNGRTIKGWTVKEVFMDESPLGRDDPWTGAATIVSPSGKELKVLTSDLRNSQPAKPAEQAAEILTAAGVTGSARIERLKDVKSGAITPDELKAAYPAKETPIKVGDTLRHTDGKDYIVEDVDGNSVDAQRVDSTGNGATIKKAIVLTSMEAMEARNRAKEARNNDIPANIEAIKTAIRIGQSYGKKSNIPNETTLREFVEKSLAAYDKSIEVNGKRLEVARLLKLKIERIPQPTSSAMVLEIKSGDSALLDVRLNDIMAMQEPANTPATKIEDSGQVLEGARKLYAKAYAAKLEEGMAMDTAAMPLSKSWPEPDYQKLIDDGASQWAVAFAHAARDEVPTKPTKAWKLKGWVESTQMLRDFTSKVLAGEMDEKLISEKMPSKLTNWFNKIDLYQAVGHAQSLKGISFTANDYGMYAGKTYNPPKTMWAVNQSSTAANASWQNGGWGKDLAVADTKAEAIEKFKTWVAAQEDKPAAPTKGTTFEIYSYRSKPNEFIVGKRISSTKSIDLKTFPSAKEARAYKTANQAELEALLEAAKVEPPERRETNAPRVGADHRMGANVTTEQFREAFGFRGEQFGASMPQAERQANMNMAYDALMDLSGVIGVPPKALSLNGELGLAFGARGRGGKNPAAAHYEADTTGAVTPNRVVINLTRKNGAGSLAHEWFHAVDNYFARQQGQQAGYMTERITRDDGVREEMRAAFRQLVSTINMTGLRERSKQLDKKRVKDYWSTGLEMTARSFESYVIAKLQDQNASNDYLANIVNEVLYAMQGAYPYPSMGEMPQIRAAFDNFFQVVQTKETEQGVAMFSRTSKADPFYSALQKEVDNIPAKAQPSMGWVMNLMGLVKAGKVKQDEVEWSGITDWLKLQTGKVTKEQVTEYMDANGVQVQETTLGSMAKDQLPSGWTVKENEDQDGYEVFDDKGIMRGGHETEYAAIQDAKYRAGIDATSETKYSQYQLPGGENYREVMLTLPENSKLAYTDENTKPLPDSDPAAYDTVQFWYVKTPDQVFQIAKSRYPTIEDAIDYVIIGKQPEKKTTYKSSHWDQPNVLAHIRLNDRTDVDGNRVLFVEEAQSDWGQDGKKRGFATGPVLKDGYSASEINGQWGIFKGESTVPVVMNKTREGALATAVQQGIATSSSVPLAPFVTATDKWLSLALKRVIKMAVDEGYDKVAFVNGEQSSDRYDLSKQIATVQYLDNNSGGVGKSELEGAPSPGRLIARDHSQKRVIDEYITDPSKLQGYVGKEVAQKLLEANPKHVREAGIGFRGRELSGLDLKVGGEGMKKFYDSIVPNTANALLKKLGGNQVEKVEIDNRVAGSESWFHDLTEEDTLWQSGFTITQAMREKAADGLPMFSQGKSTGTMPVDAIQNAVDKITGAWMRKPDIYVLQDMSEAPDRVRNYWEQQNAQGAAGGIEGFHYRDSVYLVADALKSQQDVARVLFHEALGHYGLRNVFGDSLKPILKQVAAMMPKEMAKKADQYGIDLSTEKGRLETAEEVLAEMAQTRPEMGMVKRAIAAIRTWLRENVPGFKNLQLTDSEIINSYILPARAWVERGREAAKNSAVPAFSRANQFPDIGNMVDVQAAFESYGGKGDIDESTNITAKSEAFADMAEAEGWKVNGRGDKYVVLNKSFGKDEAIVHVRVSDHSNVNRGRHFGETEINLAPDDGYARDTFDDALQKLRTASTDEDGNLMFGGKEAIRYSRASKSLQTDTKAFKDWFGDSVVTNTGKAGGKPLVVYHGTQASFNKFDEEMQGTTVYSQDIGFFFTNDPSEASSYATIDWEKESPKPNVMPIFLSIKNPMVVTLRNYESLYDNPAIWYDNEGREAAESAQAAGNDGLVVRDERDDMRLENGVQPTLYVAFDPSQIKSAIGNNGDFNPANPDIRFSRTVSEATAMNNPRGMVNATVQHLNDRFTAPGTLNWWQKTIGTQYDLAERSAPFKRVFDSVQNFINDTSYYATEAADLAPKIVPKLESWKDILKKPVSSVDSKAIAAPIFEGTLNYSRDANGKLVRVENGDGVVFTDAELKSVFKLDSEQIKLYREFRAATDKSLTNLTISHMVKLGGKDVAPIADIAMGEKTVSDAAKTLSDYLTSLAEQDKGRAQVLTETADKMGMLAKQANKLMDNGYAPLSRFGHYTVDVVDDNERTYFGLFESKLEANKMAEKMRANYPKASIRQGTVSEEEYKMFSGVAPETLELFGEMLGIDSQGSEAKDQAFQAYLQAAKANRSAMKRLIHRKGIDGFSEDAGRVLAGFIYSNARQTSTNLHAGEISQATAAIPKGQGEVKDAAIKLASYVQNPQEEAQALRGLMFAQYIGGSVASAMVNLTQPFTMTLPWLSQYGGITKAGKQMAAATRDALKDKTGDAKLDEALRHAEESGIVSPQEVHQLQAQASGKGALVSGDGTKAGDAKAMASNTAARVMLGWGKLFGVAEQFNRRSTFIAAYRTAIEQGIADPAKFAEKAIAETQGVYNKGNKPAWARGAVGSTLFTFKQFSITYMEMLGRMAMGPNANTASRMAALNALGILVLMAGVGGLPGADDLDDLISGLMQSMGYNFDSKAKRRAFLVEHLGTGGQRFVQHGLSGLPGVPIDVSGRLGLGNLIPGTGLFTKKKDHTSDVAELAGPAGELFKRAFSAGGNLVKGDFAGAATDILPMAGRNVIKAADMANMGMYRDQRGNKVIDTDLIDAAFKGIGFQPNAVKQVQDATGETQRMIAQNKIRETEIADKWAQGMFEKNQAKVADARQELADWNSDNPDMRIKINIGQILKRLQAMRLSKEQRIEKTAPREIRAQVSRELATQ